MCIRFAYSYCRSLTTAPMAATASSASPWTAVRSQHCESRRSFSASVSVAHRWHGPSPEPFGGCAEGRKSGCPWDNHSGASLALRRWPAAAWPPGNSFEGLLLEHPHQERGHGSVLQRRQGKTKPLWICLRGCDHGRSRPPLRKWSGQVTGMATGMAMPSKQSRCPLRSPRRPFLW